MALHREPAILRAGLRRDALVGRTLIVTGGGGSIGREVALACAWLGARVVVADLSEAGRDTAEDIVGMGGDAHFVPADIADEGFVDALVEATVEIYGPPDILVNSVWLTRPASVAELSVALFDRTLAVNLRGPFLSCRAVLPHMLARGDGLIVNLVATETLPGLGADIAARQGLVGMTRSLAGELGDRGVRVVALDYGSADTPGLRAVVSELAPRLGLTAEQLRGVGLHPAYAGPMPAEHVGAAAAYLIAGGGAGYHGALVRAATLLERAGLIPAALADLHGFDDLPDGARLARAISERLHGVISEARAEFSLLPLFAQPLARHSRAHFGQSLHDWDETIADLERELAHIEAEEDPIAGFALHARWERLRDSLAHLQHYYARVPEETARYSSDQLFLRQVQSIAERRVQLIGDLLFALERV